MLLESVCILNVHQTTWSNHSRHPKQDLGEPSCYKVTQLPYDGAVFDYNCQLAGMYVWQSDIQHGH